MAEHEKSEVITKSKVDKAISLLKEQKPKEREDVSDREAVRKMRRYIEKLTSSKYGYTYDEVAEMLKGLGIHLSGSRIKYLIGELKKSSRSVKKAQSSGNNESSEPTTEAQKAVQTSHEADKSSENNAQSKRKSKQATQQQQKASANQVSEPNNHEFTPKLYSREDL
ncbi:hypothetical protein [Nostoc parmelioides]|uniref:Mobilization protein MobC n=1 Tax=Nostoc parmelioides FACHB-3921 TaxID=2692909 RepID=A0ABR8BSE3_9NOSO|nr:hypothetical protein [Nostoc parmelioides]MBD2255833.1 hypothetical protein [Nostoc parmelioides FACHB-3921]